MKGTRTIALGGVVTAMIVVALYMGTIIRTNTISFLIFATYIGGISCIVGGFKGGIITYLSSAILSYLIIPDKIYALAYAIAGIYPVVKLFCENRNKVIEYLMKFIWYNISVGVIIYSTEKYRQLILNEWMGKSIYILIIAFILIEAFFIVYDVIFTQFISFVCKRIKINN